MFFIEREIPDPVYDPFGPSLIDPASCALDVSCITLNVVFMPKNAKTRPLSSKPPSKRWFGIFILCGVGAAFLIAEVLIRVGGYAPDIKPIRFENDDCVYRRSSNPILGFELKADYQNSDPDYIATYERTNSHGQRDRDRVLNKTEGITRILLLGDSVVEGHGLPESHTLSSELERLFEGSEVEVLNFGVSAYCTLAEVELLRTKGIHFEPDMVILMFVENDFDNFNREAFSLATEERPALANRLFESSDLFRLISLRLNLFGYLAEQDPVRWNSKAVGNNNVVDGFRLLRSLAETHGFTPLVAIWPHFYDNRITEGPTLPGENGRVVALELAHAFGLPTARLAPAFQNALRVGASPRNPRLAFSQGDGLHPNKKGVEVASRALKMVIDSRASLELKEPLPLESLNLGDTLTQLGSGQPDYARVLHREGVEYLKAGELDRAIERFNEALGEDQSHAGAYSNRGVAHRRQGLDQQAIQDFQKAIALQPDFHQAHFNLAQIQIAQGESLGAIRSLRKVVEIKPDQADALNLLGVELGHLQQFREAEKTLRSAVAADPKYSEAYNNLGVVLYAQQHLNAALEAFQKALEIDPKNRGAQERIAIIQSQIKGGSGH